jgi:hypothetical protein
MACNLEGIPPMAVNDKITTSISGGRRGAKNGQAGTGVGFEERTRETEWWFLGFRVSELRSNCTRAFA